jgi:hypothetical protein
VPPWPPGELEEVMQIDPRAATKDIRRVQRLLKKVDRGLDKVAARTANKVATGARTDATRLIRQEVALPAREVRGAFIIHKATWGHPVATLAASARRAAPLDHYPARPKSTAAKRPPKGVAVKIKKKLPHKTVRGAFWATVHGHRLLFKRKGKKRSPIKRLYGPSMMTYYRRKSLQRRLRRRVDIRLARVYAQELNYLVNGGKKGQ